MINIVNGDIGYGEKLILNSINLSIVKGEFVGVIGSSGAGKTTLLRAITNKADIISGNVRVLGFDLSSISKKDLILLRSKIGFIFQGFNLVNRMNAIENVLSGMLHKISLFRSIIKLYKDENIEKAYLCLKTVGLEKEALSRCDKLSGGQRQRVAIARALAQEPEMILADEPVAALDPYSAKEVMDILNKINKELKVTVVANLHQLEIAKDYSKRIVGVNNGNILFDNQTSLLSKSDTDEIYKKLIDKNICFKENSKYIQKSIQAITI